MLFLRDELVWLDVPKTDVFTIRQRKLDWMEKPMILCAAFRVDIARRLCDLQDFISNIEISER